ncbi:MAG TPA: Uma2 family endonuclease [Thermomicrobiales bacterium]|jgi:Uma2 family endonuclease
MVSTIAPWAEPVPGVDRRVTADELLRWPEDLNDQWRYELIAGRLVRMSPTGFEHGEVTLNLSAPLHSFVKRHKLGVVTAAETGYLLSQLHEGDTVFAPDIAFISTSRLANQPAPGTTGRRSYLRVAPDLAIEVASPDQHRSEMAAKAQHYLTAGVQHVWIIWPGRREVDVWRSGSPEPIATLKDDDWLAAPELLPGFEFRIADLFS